MWLYVRIFSNFQLRRARGFFSDDSVYVCIDMNEHASIRTMLSIEFACANYVTGHCQSSFSKNFKPKPYFQPFFRII